MGSLRFLLAFLVVYGHCYYPFGRFGLSGENAVQIFYVISGFYMTLVLREKYAVAGERNLKGFYLNRWLRIYPAYILVAALSLSLCAMTDWLGWRPDPAHYLSLWSDNGRLDGWPSLWLGMSQLTMIGLDTFNLSAFAANGDIVLNASQGSGEDELWRLLLVPQAWSLSVEIYFYALAPFIVTRSLRAVVWLAAASFLVRLGLWELSGLYRDPWSYRFFPSELLFFLAGAVAYRLYAGDGEMKDVSARSKAAVSVAMVVMLFSAVWIGKLDQPLRLSSWIPPAVTATVFVVLPALFAATRSNVLDRLVGELSYPIYVSHILIIWLIGEGSYHVGRGGFLLASLLVLLASCALYRWVDLPIDRFRHRLIGRAAPLPAGAMTPESRNAL